LRVLIAEDDALSRRLLQSNLERAGHDVVTTCDGAEAWEALRAGDAPRLAVLDWMMPQVDGVEVCRRVRGAGWNGYIYLILLTARSQPEDRVEGFEAGADDYLTKPFDAAELRSRVAVGARILTLHEELEEQVERLSRTAGGNDGLQGILPICMHCKKIRDEEVWHRLETYIEQRSAAEFTHSLCSECLATHYPAHST
jgi:sigma-B regulation protein RsbU (phosphoserine phosphatase)